MRFVGLVESGCCKCAQPSDRAGTSPPDAPGLHLRPLMQVLEARRTGCRHASYQAPHVGSDRCSSSSESASPKEGLIIQTFMCGAWKHHHFPCVWRVPRTRIHGQSPCKRGENVKNPKDSDLINSQERIDQSYPKSVCESLRGIPRRHFRRVVGSITLQHRRSAPRLLVTSGSTSGNTSDNIGSPEVYLSLSHIRAFGLYLPGPEIGLPLNHSYR